MLIWLWIALARGQEALDLEGLLREAAASPSLAAGEARVRALREREAAAGLWMDPMLELAWRNVALGDFGLESGTTGFATDMAMAEIMLEQALPRRGMLGLEREAALTARAAAEAMQQADVLMVRAEIAQMYWELAMVRQLRAARLQHAALVEEMLIAARARYEAGMTGQSALLQLELLRQRLASEAAQYEPQERALAASLAAMLGRDAVAVVTPDALVPAPLVGDLGAARPALARQPQLAALAQERQMKLLDAQMARVEARPQLSVWAGYHVQVAGEHDMDGADLVSAGIKLPIPLSAARQGRAGEAAAREEAAGIEADARARELAIGADLDAAYADWATAWQRAEDYQQRLLPTARAAWSSALIDYRAGRADLAELFEMARMILEMEEMRLEAAAQTHIRRAQVEALLGSVTAPTAP